MKNRSRSEIVKSILEAANAGEGASRTRLMYESYLAYNQLKEYLETLQESALIDYEVGMRCYRITEKGTRLLHLQNKFDEIAPINYVNLKNS
ncbi:MAG: winged helix-turn-helix domain-containing protein [Candidatus Nitrosopolaris sp.]